MFNSILISVVMKSPANLRYPKYSDDQKLGLRYRGAMQRIMRESQDKWDSSVSFSDNIRLNANFIFVSVNLLLT